ncbi:Organic cation transporter protein [Eumeta japonica]|uniref:Organic cation transporter protein n=1 Tax=Eumeta variegata TaxID=151549 RepID=A0A4C1WUL9_EUMVA|nr:Organic cation transporter protein [Eumeta japonica]
MLGVTLKDRKRAADIRSTTKVEDVPKKMRRLKWRWTGHMTSESRMKWSKIKIEWQPRNGKEKEDRDRTAGLNPTCQWSVYTQHNHIPDEHFAVTEMVGPRYRVLAGATLTSFFSVGQVLLGAIARAVRPWRTLTLVLYAPQLVTVAYFWLMTESVRWLLSKRRYADAAEVLRAAAAANGKRLSERAAAALRASAERERLEAERKAAERAQAPWLPMLVLRSRPMLFRVLVSPIWWISTTFIYYGMSINSVNLSGDGYFNYMAVTAIEIPGFCTAYFLLDRAGRRPVLCAAFWLCAACQFGYVFLPGATVQTPASLGYCFSTRQCIRKLGAWNEDFLNSTSVKLIDNLVYIFEQWAVSLTLYLVGKYCIAIVVAAVYVFTAELYPTQHRHSLFAFSSMIGRIGSITAPMTPALAQTVWEGLPSTLFGSCALLSGFLILLMPETRGVSLPDTMHDAERVGQAGPSAKDDAAHSKSSQ